MPKVEKRCYDRRIIELAHQQGVPVLVDGAQAALFLKDVAEAIASSGEDLR